MTKVSELNNPITNQWDAELVNEVFWEEDAANILAIPVRPELEDTLAWHFDSKGTFSVKSAYHVLDDGFRGPSGVSEVKAQAAGGQ